jgi:hypothetical protein
MAKQADCGPSVNLDTYGLPYHRALKQAEEEYAAAYWATEVWRDAAIACSHPAAVTSLIEWVSIARECRARLERLQLMKRDCGPTAGVP